jgi:C_GCAxxG_C_C family probable redox protein
MPENKSREKLLNAIETDAHDFEYNYRGCSRSCLLSLQKHFSLGNVETIKAATPLAAGIAFKGEVCGALLGGIMGLGLVTAAESVEDQKALGRTLTAGYKLYNRFIHEMGTANCFEIQKDRLGKAYNLANPQEYEAFQKEGGYVECSKVVGKGARLAAEMILELKEKEEKGGSKRQETIG